MRTAALVGYVVGEQAHGLDYSLGKVVGSFCHVVQQVYLELEVLAIAGFVEQCAREVALAAYLLGFLDVYTIRGLNVLGFHSLRDKLRRHQSWFATVRTLDSMSTLDALLARGPTCSVGGRRSGSSTLV